MFKSISDHLDKENTGIEGTLQIGIVVDNNDSNNTTVPGKFSRLKVRVSLLHSGHTDTQLPWCLPMLGGLFGNAPGIGSVNIPAIGSKVGVFFPSDDPTNTFYIGSTVDASNSLASLCGSNYPNVYVSQNLNGDLIFIDPTAKTWLLNLADGSFVNITNGQINIAASQGLKINVFGSVNINASGAVNISGSSINLNPTTNPASSLTLQTRTAPSPTTFNNQTNY